MFSYSILIYVALMISVVSLIQLIPLKKRNYPLFILRSALTLFNIVLVVSINSLNLFVALISLGLTLVFCLFNQLLFRYLLRQLDKKGSRPAIQLFRLNKILNPAASSNLLMLLIEDGGPEQIAELLAANNEDQDLLGIALFYISLLDKPELKNYLLTHYDPDLTKPGVSLLTVMEWIKHHLQLGEFQKAESFLKYFDRHFGHLQFRGAHIQNWLLYYHFGGNTGQFQDFASGHADILSAANIEEIRKIPVPAGLHNESPISPEEKSGGQLTLRKPMPLVFVSFMTVIALVSIWVMISSAGNSSWIGKLIQGPLYIIEYIEAGGLSPFLVRTGQWFRLITVVFLHGGIIHLAFNLYGLYHLSNALTRFFTEVEVLALFFLTAVGASLATSFFSEVAISVGASGEYSVCLELC
jgi:membrane associated rhomboid family serine protease